MMQQALHVHNIALEVKKKKKKKKKKKEKENENEKGYMLVGREGRRKCD